MKTTIVMLAAMVLSGCAHVPVTAPPKKHALRVGMPLDEFIDKMAPAPAGDIEGRQAYTYISNAGHACTALFRDRKLIAKPHCVPTAASIAIDQTESTERAEMIRARFESQERDSQRISDAMSRIGSPPPSVLIVPQR